MPEVALIAGGGQLPSLVAESLKQQKISVSIIAFKGFATAQTLALAQEKVDLLDIGRVLDLLNQWRPQKVVLLGAVKRPGFQALMGAYAGFRNRAYLKDVLRQGDDHILRGVISLLQECGHQVAGVHELCPDLLVQKTCFTARQPDKEGRQVAYYGFSLLEALSPYDIGQGIALEGKRVLAIEGPEGTNQMLARVGTIKGRRFLKPAEGGGVFIKAAKTGQDWRIDLPVIGPKTVIAVAQAGLEGIAIKAKAALVLDIQETIDHADRHHIWLAGL